MLDQIKKMRITEIPLSHLNMCLLDNGLCMEMDNFRQCWNDYRYIKISRKLFHDIV